MSPANTNKENSLQEQKLLELIRNLSYGQLLISIKDGKPIRVEEIRKSIQL